LALAMGVSAKFGWPNNVVRVAINLLAAWITIWLASIAVRNPLWSRAIMVSAYTIAVLNILHLLTPTLDVLDSLSATFGNLRISVLTVLRGMLSLAVLLWVAMLVSGVLERRIQKLPNFTPSVQVLIGKLFKATVITIAVVVSLAGVGIDLTAIAVFSGAVGVGIGFGLQKVVSNLISGIIVLMDRSIKPGDIIQIGDTYGWVSSLGARYVSIETRNGTEFLIPNEDIVTKQVTNWTHRNDLVPRHRGFDRLGWG
jgi:small-conductance mechanosensitive channel